MVGQCAQSSWHETSTEPATAAPRWRLPVSMATLTAAGGAAAHAACGAAANAAYAGGARRACFGPPPPLASGCYSAGQCAQSSWNGSFAEVPVAAPGPGSGRLIQGGSESESVQPESE